MNKFFAATCCAALLSVAAADVSHLMHTYLPPHMQHTNSRMMLPMPMDLAAAAEAGMAARGHMMRSMYMPHSPSHAGGSKSTTTTTIERHELRELPEQIEYANEWRMDDSSLGMSDGDGGDVPSQDMQPPPPPPPAPPVSTAMPQMMMAMPTMPTMPFTVSPPAPMPMATPMTMIRMMAMHSTMPSTIPSTIPSKMPSTMASTMPSTMPSTIPSSMPTMMPTTIIPTSYMMPPPASTIMPIQPTFRDYEAMMRRAHEEAAKEANSAIPVAPSDEEIATNFPQNGYHYHRMTNSNVLPHSH